MLHTFALQLKSFAPMSTKAVLVPFAQLCGDPLSFSRTQLGRRLRSELRYPFFGSPVSSRASRLDCDFSRTLHSG